MTATAEIDRVRALVQPIASDLELDLYDVERSLRSARRKLARTVADLA